MTSIVLHAYDAVRQQKRRAMYHTLFSGVASSVFLAGNVGVAMFGLAELQSVYLALGAMAAPWITLVMIQKNTVTKLVWNPGNGGYFALRTAPFFPVRTLAERCATKPYKIYPAAALTSVSKKKSRLLKTQYYKLKIGWRTYRILRPVGDNAQRKLDHTAAGYTFADISQDLGTENDIQRQIKVAQQRNFLERVGFLRSNATLHGNVELLAASNTGLLLPTADTSGIRSTKDKLKAMVLGKLYATKAKQVRVREKMDNMTMQKVGNMPMPENMSIMGMMTDVGQKASSSSSAVVASSLPVFSQNDTIPSSSLQDKKTGGNSMDNSFKILKENSSISSGSRKQKTERALEMRKKQLGKVVGNAVGTSASDQILGRDARSIWDVEQGNITKTGLGSAGSNSSASSLASVFDKNIETTKAGTANMIGTGTSMNVGGGMQNMVLNETVTPSVSRPKPVAVASRIDPIYVQKSLNPHSIPLSMKVSVHKDIKRRTEAQDLRSKKNKLSDNLKKSKASLDETKVVFTGIEWLDRFLVWASFIFPQGGKWRGPECPYIVLNTVDGGPRDYEQEHHQYIFLKDCSIYNGLKRKGEVE